MLAEQVIARFVERGSTLALAESCTGGLVSHRLTNVPGSSDVLIVGIVVYSNKAKTRLARVEPATLERTGPYSHEVARELAVGVRRILSSTVGLGITGLAGPSGGTPALPVGTVFMSVSTIDQTTSHQFHFSGDREEIKLAASTQALELLEKEVI